MRRQNPAAMTIALVAAGAGAVAAGLGGAYLWRRRKAPIAEAPTQASGFEPAATSSTWTWSDADAPGYPWPEPRLHVENVPTPGMFLDTGDATGEFDPSRGIDALVTALLGSALVMAGWDPVKARALATAQGKDAEAQLGKMLRREVRRALVEPLSWNDRLYGQTNANYAGGVDPGKPCMVGTANAPCIDGIRDPNSPRVSYMMSPVGRGLNWLPRHGNVLDAIGDARAPRRGTSLDGEPLGDDGAHMLLWMPAFDLAALAPPNPRVRLLAYPGGRSTIDPPPVVTDLGIDMHGVELAA